MRFRYKKVVPATFLRRDNRFIATVNCDGEEMKVHVKNTGRCRELLVPGCRAYLALSENENRRTSADLVAVEKKSERGRILINLDSQLPNIAAIEWLPKSGLFSENAVFHREVSYGDSRFDVYVEDGERRAFVEVKGVTLERDGIAMFPDAPTARGVKHLSGLTRALADGFESYVLFVIQMKGTSLFTPNRETDMKFAVALEEAEKSGVRILAYDAFVYPDGMDIDSPIPVRLDFGNEND